MQDRLKFYKDVVNEFIRKDSSVLIVTGGINDRDVFLQAGFSKGIISSLDKRTPDNLFAPFIYAFQDVHHLQYNDNSFDYVVSHAGLHHCSSPHRALLEMYRVARRGILVVEARDNFTVNLMQRFSLATTHETAAVYHNSCQFGGVNNSQIPNFVYRWTENEVEKTISSFAPYAKHNFQYRYGVATPIPPQNENSFIKKSVILIFTPLYKIFVSLFPKQKNLFAFYIEKPELLINIQPWLKLKNGEMEFDKKWADKKYLKI